MTKDILCCRKLKIDNNRFDPPDLTPLQITLENRCIKCFEYLLNNSLYDEHAKDMHPYCKSFFILIRYNDARFLNLLLEKKYYVSITEIKYIVGICFVELKYTEQLNKIKLMYISHNECDIVENLLNSCKNGRIGEVKKIIKNYPRINPNMEGFVCANKSNNIELVKIMTTFEFQKNKTIKIKDFIITRALNKALFNACKNNNKDLVKYLINFYTLASLHCLSPDYLNLTGNVFINPWNTFLKYGIRGAALIEDKKNMDDILELLFGEKIKHGLPYAVRSNNIKLVERILLDKNISEMLYQRAFNEAFKKRNIIMVNILSEEIKKTPHKVDMTECALVSYDLKLYQERKIEKIKSSSQAIKYIYKICSAPKYIKHDYADCIIVFKKLLDIIILFDSPDFNPFNNHALIKCINIASKNNRIELVNIMCDKLDKIKYPIFSITVACNNYNYDIVKLMIDKKCAFINEDEISLEKLLSCYHRNIDITKCSAYIVNYIKEKYTLINSELDKYFTSKDLIKSIINFI